MSGGSGADIQFCELLYLASSKRLAWCVAMVCEVKGDIIVESEAEGASK